MPSAKSQPSCLPHVLVCSLSSYTNISGCWQPTTVCKNTLVVTLYTLVMPHCFQYNPWHAYAHTHGTPSPPPPWVQCSHMQEESLCCWKETCGTARTGKGGRWAWARKCTDLTWRCSSKRMKAALFFLAQTSKKGAKKSRGRCLIERVFCPPVGWVGIVGMCPTAGMASWQCTGYVSKAYISHIGTSFPQRVWPYNAMSGEWNESNSDMWQVSLKLKLCVSNQSAGICHVTGLEMASSGWLLWVF